MKKIRYPFIILLLHKTACQAQFFLPQLQAGVYVNDSVYSFTYNFPGNCDTLSDLNLRIDSSLIQVATGVYLSFIVTQLTTLPGSVYTVPGGVININDTLTFTNTSDNYTFFSSSQGDITLKLVITGIPTIPFENYFCEFNHVTTLGICFNASQVQPAFTTCIVDDYSGSTELYQNDNALYIFPNPVTDILNVNFYKKSGARTIRIFNILGETVVHDNVKVKAIQLNVADLKSGIYGLMFADEQHSDMVKFVRQ